jgi:hypothetical protein
VASELHQEQLAGDLGPFSGAVLAQLEDGKPLYPQLKAWAGLVAPGGLLIGKQHTDLRLRSELARAAPSWRPWPNGLWLVEVNGLRVNGSPMVAPEVPGDLAWTVDELPASPVAGVELSGISAGAVELPASLPEAGPIRPPVLNLKRTRPVWETLESNLGLT